MLHLGCVKLHQKFRDFVGLPMGLLREESPKNRMNTGLFGSRSGEYGLKAAQKLMTPILRPILGIPGICGIALVSSLQSTDAGAGMTRQLHLEKQITDNELLIFSAFQFTAGGLITNYLSSGSALFGFLTVPISIPLAVLFVMKIFGANMMRAYVKIFCKEAA